MECGPVGGAEEALALLDGEAGTGALVPAQLRPVLRVPRHPDEQPPRLLPAPIPRPFLPAARPSVRSNKPEKARAGWAIGKVPERHGGKADPTRQAVISGDASTWKVRGNVPIKDITKSLSDLLGVPRVPRPLPLHARPPPGHLHPLPLQLTGEGWGDAGADGGVEDGELGGVEGVPGEDLGEDARVQLQEPRRAQGGLRGRVQSLPAPQAPFRLSVIMEGEGD